MIDHPSIQSRIWGQSSTRRVRAWLEGCAASCLGDESFKDRLLSLVAKTAKRLRGKGSHTGRALGEHGEREAGRLVTEGLAALGMADVPLKELR